MTDRLYAKYMWLISTIYDAGKISFEDIARKWDDAYTLTYIILITLMRWRMILSTNGCSIPLLLATS